ncbi:YqeG family HAD IIIA-type phosphatase [Bacillus thermotolerans]|uniref:Hydrolase, HAD subfamily IIIA n=1 Tax=Bacillus thermotolerans TaxID=1221996 RepID=A0A0F5HT06_BACTR|nr:YqeG family HAD IIIA-type phosphatase [Bacillus thermotolerans]KKB36393.1 Hydrolase, HAD subfamily IIIA [Bacillus thermotolerans]KKB43168.1 Hydrolase, HAD subfamily IIIA [Bacillus thermotolerans]KKB43571.1 Hydrolase, HAD subfamily IIIA [Bacillus thermotolerans]
MLKKFLPSRHVKSIFQIKPEELKAQGIKAVITDLDNTLVAWDRPDATPELKSWFGELKKAGIKVIIISNNNEKRVRDFAVPLDIPYIFQARKPMGRAFREAVNVLNVKKEETVVVGDQLLTDIFGGNRGGFYTILVVPVAQTDGVWTRFNRLIERRIMNFFKRKGLIRWEENK